MDLHQNMIEYPTLHLDTNKRKRTGLLYCWSTFHMYDIKWYRFDLFSSNKQFNQNVRSPGFTPGF